MLGNSGLNKLYPKDFDEICLAVISFILWKDFSKNDGLADTLGRYWDHYDAVYISGTFVLIVSPIVAALSLLGISISNYNNCLIGPAYFSTFRSFFLIAFWILVLLTTCLLRRRAGNIKAEVEYQEYLWIKKNADKIIIYANEIRDVDGKLDMSGSPEEDKR